MLNLKSGYGQLTGKAWYNLITDKIVLKPC